MAKSGTTIRMKNVDGKLFTKDEGATEWVEIPKTVPVPEYMRNKEAYDKLVKEIAEGKGFSIVDGKCVPDKKWRV